MNQLSEDSPMRSIRRRSSVIAGFALLLILLGINTVILERQLAVQVGNQEWFSHSRRVAQELRNTEALLKDAESGERGFLYTGRVEYLVPYNFASSQIDAHLQNLRNLIGSDTGQQAQVAQLETLIHQRLAELAQTISIFQSGDAPGAKALMMSHSGLATMESIRSLLGQMEQYELSIGDARRYVYQKSIKITAACIYLASSIAALGLVLLAFANMRELKRREQDAASLRRSEEWFRVTLSSIGDGVIATDEQGSVSFLNSVAEHLIGTTLDEVKGKKIGEIFPIFSETTNNPLENPVQQLLTLGYTKGKANQTVLRQRNGQLLPIEDTAATITDDAGKLIGAVLVFHDASRERRFQEVLRRTEKLAAAARLAATVSHEINNPLEAVGNLIFLAKLSPETSEQTKELLHLAEQELARVAHITKQTLGFYRESALPTSVDIPVLIESALKLYSNKLQMKQIQLQLALAPCPPITGLAGEIQQLVSNIISNAIDALPHRGTLNIDASFVTLIGSESIRLTIMDDGPGIAPENLKRIFEPFFTTKKDVGTGLGLWVCKEIAERHGGSVQAHSRNETGVTGAVFTVHLPYQGELRSVGATHV
jgi:PAS domain S-box-containing protein